MPRSSSSSTTPDADAAAPAALARRGAVLLVAYGVYVALSTYFVLAYVGPGAWVGELQRDYHGSVHAGVSVLALVVPVALVGRLPPVRAAIRAALGLDLAQIVQDRWRPVAIAAFGVFLAYSLGRGAFARDVGRVDVAAVPSDAVFAEVFGEPLTAVSKQKGSAIPMVYIPLRGAGEGAAARVVLEVQENEIPERLLRDGARVGARGVVTDEVPGDVRFRFRQQGIALRDDARLVRTRTNPKHLGWAAALGGGFCLLFAAWVWRRT